MATNMLQTDKADTLCTSRYYGSRTQDKGAQSCRHSSAIAIAGKMSLENLLAEKSIDPDDVNAALPPLLDAAYNAHEHSNDACTSASKRVYGG